MQRAGLVVCRRGGAPQGLGIGEVVFGAKSVMQGLKRFCYSGSLIAEGCGE